MRPLTTSTELITPLRVQWSLRVAFAIVFCWFGGLKIVDNSPAHDLVEATLQWTQIDSISHLLGMWEVVIASCFLIPRITRFTLAMFLVHMAGTFMPLVTLPELSYISFPLGLSLIGQYILKNVVFLAAGSALYLLWRSHEHEAPLS